MTREYREYAKSRIEYLLKISSFVFDERDKEALEAAIQALSQEPTDDKCHYCEHTFTPYKGNTGDFTEQEPCTDAVSRRAVLDEAFEVDTKEYGRIAVVGVDAIDALPSVAQKSGWIPVDERLPEWNIECLVVDDKGEFGVGFYRDDVGAWDSPSWGWLERKDDVDNHDAYYMPCGIGKVVAWMPLPKPYEPQESEE